MSLNPGSRKALWIVFGLYVFNWLTYSFTITYSMLYKEDFNFWTEVLWQLRRMGLDQTIKALLSVPVWWIIFVWLKNRPLSLRLTLHIPIAFLFALSFRYLFYQACDLIDWGHLGGYGSIWDIYIPVLFYFIQFGIFHSIEYHQAKLEAQKKNARLQQIQDQAELNALKAQLNPHFLYNVFNTINASIPRELESTREMIASLSDLFRFHLEASRSMRIPLGDELDFIEKYLQLEQARFGDRLTWVIDAASDLRKKQVPPLLIHPLVENAVKHGISPELDGGRIWIKVQQEGNRLLFEVGDNGSGAFKQGEITEGTGLGNTRERLERGYGENMQIDSAPNEGFVIRFGLNTKDEEGSDN